jgi:hypothetical protein
MRHKGGLGKAGAHPAIFPVTLASEMLTAFSDACDLAFEPFSGSGTTIIAAEMTGRACHAIELSPAYVDVAVKRWQDFAGKQAVLDGDGRTFDEVASERPKAISVASAAGQGKPGSQAAKGQPGADKRSATAAA